MLDIIKEYASKRIDLLKMEATEKTASSLGMVAFIVPLIILILFFLMLFNVGLGLLIGFYLGNYGWGVLIVAGFYLLLIAVLFALKSSLKIMVANKIIGRINK